jgi:septal ring factor EnvC (AmiA/AmiB activator)
MAPFVASLDKLAAVHEGMARERARDREQEDKRASLEMDQLERKRKFERMCELRDLGRQFRRERVQLDSKAENFAALKGFYDEEIKSIEVELSELVDD